MSGGTKAITRFERCKTAASDYLVNDWLRRILQATAPAGGCPGNVKDWLLYRLQLSGQPAARLEVRLSKTRLLKDGSYGQEPRSAATCIPPPTFHSRPTPPSCPSLPRTGPAAWTTASARHGARERPTKVDAYEVELQDSMQPRQRMHITGPFSTRSSSLDRNRSLKETS